MRPLLLSGAVGTESKCVVSAACLALVQEVESEETVVLQNKQQGLLNTFYK